MAALALSLASTTACPLTLKLGTAPDTVVGQLETTLAEKGDTLLDVGRRNGMGFYDMKSVNPTVDTWLPPLDTEIILPKAFVLPDTPRQGIVLNIPEMRLFYYRPDRKTGAMEVLTFPIGIGREGWNTPYITTRIASKQANPSWYPPETIRKEHAAEGHPLPKRVPPGPDNPLGDFAMRLGVPQYLIHGTNKPWGVGMRVSHGCIRMYPEDISFLFHDVPIGTPVRIVNQPYKVGRRDDRIYLEAHPALDEDADRYDDNLTSVVRMIVSMTEEESYRVDWDLARQVIRDRRGVPIEIGRFLPRAHDDSETRTADRRTGIDLRIDSRLSTRKAE